MKEKMESIIKKQKGLFVSYAIVAGIILIVYILLHIYPFGEYAIIKTDLLQGHLPSFNDFMEKLRNGQGVAYSWSGGLGNQLYTQMLTLWVSPFTLLMSLFPTSGITEAAALCLLLKIPFSAVTFHIYIRRHYPRSTTINVGFSVMYALCAYVTALYVIVPWIDTVILLPLVALGLEKLVREKKSNLYSISLGIAILCGYGTAFFLCCFSVVYFLILMILSEKEDRTDKRAKIWLFASRSLLAGGLSAVTLIPSLMALRDTYVLGSVFPTNLEIYNSPFRFLANHYFGVHPTVLAFSDSVPNVYCGILTIGVLPLYYSIRSISRKEKTLYTLFLILLFLCSDINILIYIVHGLHFPSMFPHRFSFIYSFLLLLMARKVLANIEKEKAAKIAGCFVFSIALLLALSYFYPQTEVKKPGKISETTLTVSLVLLLLYGVLLLLWKFKKKVRVRKIISIVLVAVVCMEATGNTYIHFSHMNDANRYGYVNEFLGGMNQVTAELDNETEFYRAEFKHHACLSDPRLYGYNGVNTFSTISYPLTELMGRLGLDAAANRLVLTNPTPLVNSILAVKYLFNRNAKMQETFTIFDYKENRENVYVYENPYVLPVGFMTDMTMADWLPDLSKASDDPFEVQNDYVQKAAGLEQPVFHPVSDIKIEEEKLAITSYGDDNTFNYEISEDVTAEMEPSVFFSFTAKESAYTYIHIRTKNATQGRVWVNDRYVLQQSMPPNACSLDAGFVNAGDTVRIQIVLNRKTSNEDQELIRTGSVQYHAAQMDLPAFENTIAELKKNPLKVSYYDEDTVQGTVEADEEGYLFTSIPYDTGWEILVDGKKVNGVRIGGGLLGIRMYEGKHTVSLQYHASGFFAGFIISLLSLTLLIFLWLRGQRLSGRKKIPVVSDAAEKE